MRVCQRQRRHFEKPSREWLSVSPFTRAFLKSPSSRGLSAIAELLVICACLSSSRILQATCFIHSSCAVLCDNPAKTYAVQLSGHVVKADAKMRWIQYQARVATLPWKSLKKYLFFQNLESPCKRNMALKVMEFDIRGPWKFSSLSTS